MRDVDNNINKPNNYNTQNYQKPIAETVKIQEDVSTKELASKEISDLSAMPSASLGKTMITSDNTESDMMFLLKNPTQVAQMNAIVDKYIENHSAEETIKLIDAYKNEFIVNKNKH